MKSKRFNPIAAFLVGAALTTAAPVFAQQPALGTDAEREAGRLLYNERCAQCHGEDGAGDGIAATFFRPAPRDFTSGTFKFRTTASGELPTDEDLRRSIREGMPYTGMPAWPNLSDAQVTNLIYYIKTFADDFSGPYGTPTPIEIPRAPGSSAESIARGREVYLENQCSDCHGLSGRGDGASAPTLQDQWGAHIRPADLTKRWTFRNGSDREDIFRTFSTGLDGSPMPSYDIDPPEDKWHLVNYVYSLSRDEANYATLVVADAVDGPIDIRDDSASFAEAAPAYFPIFGQVIEPGRAFFPGVNGIEVRAAYTADEIAFRLSWHDMTAETNGSNSPTIVVDEAADSTDEPFTDAVAIQLPSEMPTGSELPYLLFGDSRRTVDLWYVEMGSGEARRFTGSGSGNLQPEAATLEVATTYNEGEWTATFKQPRTADGVLQFDEGAFIPIAFSVWDGFNDERGNKRGMTSWFYAYIEPATQPSPAGPMTRSVLLALFLGFGMVALVRKKNHAMGSFMPDRLREDISKGRVDVALDVVRVGLGVALFVRGILFATDTSRVVDMIQSGDLAIAPGIFIYVVVVAHIVGGLMLIAGFRTRVAALIQIPILIGAVLVAISQGGLFMEQQSLELAVLVLVLLIVFYLFGSGHYSLDEIIFRRHAPEPDLDVPTTNVVGLAVAFGGIATLVAILVLGSRLVMESFTFGDLAAVVGATVLIFGAFLLFYGFALRGK